MNTFNGTVRTAARQGYAALRAGERTGYANMDPMHEGEVR
jgi:hypothetical protein